MADTALVRVAAQPALDRIATPLREAVVAPSRNAGNLGIAVTWHASEFRLDTALW